MNAGNEPEIDGRTAARVDNCSLGVVGVGVGAGAGGGAGGRSRDTATTFERVAARMTENLKSSSMHKPLRDWP